jgi:signal peptidase II
MTIFPTMTKSWAFWPVAVTVLLTDCATKDTAVARLTPHVPHDVLGDILCFTLVFNPGAAMGTTLGPYSRWGFTALALLVVGIIGLLYRDTHPGDRWRVVALALLTGGALGNAVDRIRSAAGVVDFIDIGIGSARFWTFNVADMAVCCGAALLAAAMLRKSPTDHA